MKWNAYILPNERDQKKKYGVKKDDKNSYVNIYIYMCRIKFQCLKVMLYRDWRKLGEVPTIY
jgi:hypothetical protein